MGPKINGYSIAELVSSSVDRQMEKKFGDSVHYRVTRVWV